MVLTKRSAVSKDENALSIDSYADALLAHHGLLKKECVTSYRIKDFSDLNSELYVFKTKCK